MDVEDLIWLAVTVRGLGALRIAARYNSEIIQSAEGDTTLPSQDAIQIVTACLLVFSSHSAFSVPEGLFFHRFFVTLLHLFNFFKD